MKKIFILIIEIFVNDDWQTVRKRIEHENKKLDQFPNLSPPLIVQQLLVSGEDHRNYLHCGFDLIAIFRAIWRRITIGSREGASTIEQQLVRTITRNYDLKFRRKIKEIFLAILVRLHFSKSIPSKVYLSIAYYGWHINGYEQARKRLKLISSYISKDEAASLVARLKYPEPKSASSHRIFLIKRRKKHLLNLHQLHLLKNTYENLNDTPYKI